VRDLPVLFLHLLATVARLAGPGGARSVVAESVLVKHQLLILNRSRKRSSNLRASDRMVAGLCALLMRPGRMIRSAIVVPAKKSIGAYQRVARPESMNATRAVKWSCRSAHADGVARVVRDVLMRIARRP
jgi:hypothetical protein